MAQDGELRVGGLKIWARFTLFMTIALTVVMAGAGFFLYNTSAKVASSVQEDTLLSSIQLTAEAAEIDTERQKLVAERNMLVGIERYLADETPEDVSTVRSEVRSRREAKEQKAQSLLAYWTQVEGASVQRFPGGRIDSTTIQYGPDGESGRLFRYRKSADDAPFHLLLPADSTGAKRGLLGLIVGTTILVILVGAGVSVLVANQVSGPLEEIVHDIRQISSGDLNHHTRAKGGGEIALLARSIDRMTRNLKDAQEAQLELQIREREVEVAGEVREALLPQKTPTIEGYDLGSAHLGSPELGGDFHDFVMLENDDRGRIGLLVCDVSGRGLPGALVGATARSYLRSELMNGGDVAESLQLVNRQIAHDVKRGMYVTAFYVLVDPKEGIATVACAGHKIPLVRYTAEDKKVRLIQPEGIALGFDKGPVFDRSLEIQQVPLDPGDRLILVNTGAVSVTNPDGNELGEKPLYKQFMTLGGLSSEEFLAKMTAGLKKYAGEAPLPRDISLVTIARG
jgi:serine phosphatase RsbU (regulator of sigma subunit)